MSLFGVGFAAPWLLLGLAALPVLWLILRAVPPAPMRRMFPAVTLLLGLRDEESVSDRTPWWLLLLRMLAVAAMIIGLAGPVLNPQEGRGGSGPLLIVVDAGWADAPRWAAAQAIIADALADAARNGRTAAILELTAPEPPVFQGAADLRPRVAGIAPRPWLPSADAPLAALAQVTEPRFDTLWMSGGLDHPGRDALLAALEARGRVRAHQPGGAVLGLAPAGFDDGAVQITARRSRSGGAQEITIVARGRDPVGTMRVLASVPVRFDPTQTEARAAMVLPSELRARVARFEIQGQRAAGAVSLADDGLRRREVALLAGREDREGLELLSPLHYLRQALEPSADLLNGALDDILPANPDVIVLADVATLAPGETEALRAWIEGGGLLLRFAGPRLAASDISRDAEDPLMPVRLRAGGRTVGGAMSWGAPKSLAPFETGSPFFGLAIPPDVNVTAQVVAQPDPALADRVIAQLSDGTPLVTRKSLGAGQVVLFHVTANAEWSSLPLSGLFVEMLERLAVSSTAGTPDAGDLAGTIWTPLQVLDGFGRLRDAGTLPGVEGPALVDAPIGPAMQPGLYASDDRRIARNVIAQADTLAPARWPARISVEGLVRKKEAPLGGILLSLALLLLALDVVASLAVSGRLRGPARPAALSLLLVAGTFAFALPGAPLHAQQGEVRQNDTLARAATSEVVLAHVLTGDARVDEIAGAGLLGLSETLFNRTSVEPADPIGIDLETDEIAFFPVLYWPITPDQPRPSEAAYARLNDYLRTGGLILFDTRDADTAGFGASSPNGRRLRQLAAPLDIPPLEPLPQDHVLTRTFYLLQDFHGRHTSHDVWVEAAPPDAEQIEGMPFRNLNDGVTPVVIGGNDWAGAWAVDGRGRAMLPVGRGYGGERQRELAYRFGVNLIMHVLTGNYKSDQVHVPALLDRLGQ